jgi:hypothetical protein
MKQHIKIPHQNEPRTEPAKRIAEAVTAFTDGIYSQNLGIRLPEKEWQRRKKKRTVQKFSRKQNRR